MNPTEDSACCWHTHFSDQRFVNEFGPPFGFCIFYFFIFFQISRWAYFAYICRSAPLSLSPFFGYLLGGQWAENWAWHGRMAKDEREHVPAFCFLLCLVCVAHTMGDWHLGIYLHFTFAACK